MSTTDLNLDTVNVAVIVDESFTAMILSESYILACCHLLVSCFQVLESQSQNNSRRQIDSAYHAKKRALLACSY